MSRLLQIFFGVVLIAAVTGGFIFTRPDEGPLAAQGAAAPVPALAVDVTEPVLRELHSRVDAIGTTRAHRSINVAPLVAGRLVDVSVAPNERVEQGQVLARLDQESEQAQVMEARAALELAEIALSRARQLVASQRIAQAEVDALQADFAVAQARLQLSEKLLAERTLVAPFDGTVGFREVDPGSHVSEGMVVTTLDDLSIVEVEFSIPEIYYGVITPGMPVTLRAAAFGQRDFPGVIASVDPRVDETSRAFRVRAEVPNRDRDLPTGMFVNVSVPLDSRTAIMVPDETVVAQGKESFVFVANAGQADLRPIELGQRERDWVEVLSGLAQGEKVIAKGLQNLRDGVPVRVLDTLDYLAPVDLSAPSPPTAMPEERT